MDASDVNSTVSADVGKVQSSPLSTKTVRTYAWLIFAAMLFLLQVLPYLSYRWVTDESWFANPAYSVAHGNGIKDPAIGANDIQNHFDARPPGTTLVVATAFRLFGVGQIPARLGSVIAGLLIVVITYFLARDVLGEQGAILAMLLVATDNLIVLTSRAARPEALTTLCILLSLLAIKQYATRPSVLWALLSGLLIAAGTMFHITLLGYVCSIGLLAILLGRRQSRFRLRGFVAYCAGYLLGLAPFAIWILTAPLGPTAFRVEYLNRVVHVSLWTRFTQEGHRYADVFGFNMLHGHGLEDLPVRLPIPLLFLAAIYLLWRYRRSWFWLEILLLVPSLLWMVYMLNKSSRYVAIIAPLFALAIAAATEAVREHRVLHRVMLSLVMVVVIAQIGANVVLLRAARLADYTRVATQLRSVIPAGQTVYGTITFWLAFDDHPYISDERTDPLMAAEQLHARYLILGDRMMTSGSTTDRQFYVNLNEQLHTLIRRSKQVGNFPDPYYGNLKVYRIPER